MLFRSTIQIGDVRQANLPVIIMDLPRVRDISSKADGVLAQTFLDRVPYLLDYKRKTLWLGEAVHIELVAALAPRGLFVNAPLRDANFRWRSVDRVVAAARPVHALLGSEALLVVEHPDCEHDFPTAQREQAYAWMQRVLQRAISAP